jgi:CRP/FNR family transcriptional regulator
VQPEIAMTNWEILLQETIPFKLLDRENLQRAIERAHVRRIPHDAYLIHEGELWPYLFLIKSGEVEAVKVSHEGRSLVALTLNPGDVFWGLSFFEAEIEVPISLRAKGDLEVIYWSSEDLVPILLANGEALWSLNGLLVRRMLLASRIVEDLAFQPVAGRIAKLLLSQYGKAGSTRIERDLTLDDMAARVGTTREMVCRVLYKFADQDVIDITRTEFSIVDKEQLSKIAGEE